MEVDVVILEHHVDKLMSAQKAIAQYVSTGYDVVSSSATQHWLYHTLVKKTAPKVEED